MKHIYISPHADDVALSCGGQILANPDRRSDSLVLTVFTSQNDPSERAATNDQARFVNAIHTERDNEDEAAWKLVGVPLRTLGLPEALLRDTFPFSIRRSARDLQVKRDLHDTIASYMHTHTEAQFYFPAGIGRHVDHLLCRDVALDLLRSHAPAKIVFYEDAPYWWLRFLKKAHYQELGLGLASDDSANRLPNSGIDLLQYFLRNDVPFPRGRKLFLAVYVGLVAGVGRGARVHLETLNPTISTTTIDAKILAFKRELVYQYRSQLPMLFGERPDELLEKYRDFFATETRIEFVNQPV